jgi:hypothetical protein
MNLELEHMLVEKYPKILQDYRKSPKETCMAFGIETSDGWYNLLDKCMQKLQYLCDICSKDGREVQVVALQIKEKFGTLRFYTSMPGANEIETNILEDIISEAENQSSYTCEETGNDGTICKKGGWVKTLSYEKSRELQFTACNKETEEYWKTKDAKPTED